jgi:hypothetical protein
MQFEIQEELASRFGGMQANIGVQISSRAQELVVTEEFKFNCQCKLKSCLKMDKYFDVILSLANKCRFQSESTSLYVTELLGHDSTTLHDCAGYLA